MENTVRTPGQHIYYTEADKHFLAAYYNLALHNVFITLNHIYKRIGITEFADEGEIRSWLNNPGSLKSLAVVERARFLDLLGRHFPFLRIIQLNAAAAENTSDPGEYPLLLSRLLKHLAELRNRFSHAVYLDEAVPDYKKLCYDLYAIYDANVSQVKTDFFESNFSPTLSRAGDEFEVHFEHLRRVCKNTNPNLRDDAGRMKKSMDNPRFYDYYAFLKNDALTIHGLVFFASLFLDKKYAILMQKNVKGFKDGREIKHQMTNEVFCRSRILLPRVRLHSDKEVDAFVLDMLGELSKAPESFYEQLNKKDRERFDVLPDTESDPDAIPQPVAQVRKQNRFAYFALRYLDEVNAFTRMRFMMDLGNYHFHIYKAIINGNEESRHLTRRMLGFGKLREFNPELAPAGWKEKRKDLDYFETADEPFLRFTYPHYHLEKNIVGIRFLTEKKGSDYEAVWPHLEVEQGGNYPKYRKKEKYPQEIADAFLSGNELLALAFCHHLYRKSGNVSFTERLIEQKLFAIRKLLGALKRGELQERCAGLQTAGELYALLASDYALQKHEIPDRLADFLMQQSAKDKNALAQAKIEKLMSETEWKKKRFHALKKQTARPGKKQFQPIKPGQVADWLVRDLMRFQPMGFTTDAAGEKQPDLKSKPNPKKYQLLQKSLAQYSFERENLPGLFKACNLMRSSNEHPFLQKVVDKNYADWEGFFLGYLDERQKYLENCRKNGIKKNNFSAYFKFLHIRGEADDIVKLVDGWERQLMLPLGMFIQPIRDWFTTHGSASLKKRMSELSGDYNLVGLIREYLKYQCEDDFQAFYAETPMVYEHYKKHKPTGMTLTEREALLQSKWKPAHLANSNKLEAGKEQYEERMEVLEPLLQDLKARRNSNEILRAFRKAFDAQLIDSIFTQHEHNREKELLKSLRNGLVGDYERALKEFKNYRQMADTEKALRLRKAEDAVTLFMIDDLLIKDQAGAGAGYGLKLRDVRPAGESDVPYILNRIVELKQELPFYTCNELGELDLTQKRGNWIIYTDDTKLKNQGNFRTFVRDRRLNNLAMYVLNPVSGVEIKLHRKRIEKELELYDTLRVDTIKKMHSLEKAVFAVCPFNAIPGWEQKTFANFREYMEQFAAIKHIPKAQAVQLHWLSLVRNAMMHNQYPLPEKVPGIQLYMFGASDLPENEGLGIARQLRTRVEETVAEVIAFIKTV
jgi:hypothetical protein